MQVGRPSRADNVEVQESFTALERARHFGNSKLSLQRLVFVNELVETVHEIGYDATVKYLLPMVKKLAGDAEILVRQSLVAHFGDLAGFLTQSDPESGYIEVLNHILPLVSRLLMEKAPEVRQGASDALTTLAFHLPGAVPPRPGEDERNAPLAPRLQVLMVALQMSNNNDDEDVRATAATLFSGLAEAVGVKNCQEWLVTPLVACCEDPSMRVRKATASSFAEIAMVVGNDDAKRRLLPAFEKLTRDAHEGVRKAAAESIVKLAMELRVETRAEVLLPMMLRLLQDLSRWVQVAALKQVGYFIACLETADRAPRGLLEQYVSSLAHATPDTPDISYHCGFTFAAVVKTMSAECWPALRETFVMLCKDNQCKTRKAMAASLHIMAEALGSELTEREVLPELETLLQDMAPEVRLAALRNVAGILQVASNLACQRRVLRLLHSTAFKGRSTGTPGATKVESWRVRQLVAGQLGAVCDTLRATASSRAPGAAALAGAAADAASPAPLEKDLIWDCVLPLFLTLCEDGVAEVRNEAARATAKALRAAAPELYDGTGEEGSGGCGGNSPLSEKTSELLKKNLIRRFGRSRCFRGRMTFIRMCDSVIRESPLRVFTEHFMRAFVHLSHDRVRNVQLCWASTAAPHLRKAARLTSNVELLAAAHRMQQQLQAAKDPHGRKHPKEIEERRVFQAAPIAPLPAGVDLSKLGDDAEPFDDDEDNGLATEGGTGNSLDFGLCEDEGAEAAGQQAAAPPPPSGSPAAATESFSPPPRDGAATGRSAAPSALSDSSTKSPTQGPQLSPHSVPAVISRTPPAGSSGDGTPTRWAAHDLVEDGLCGQEDIEHDMDSMFEDRRLFHEAEHDAPEEFGRKDSDEDLLGSLHYLDQAVPSPPSSPPPPPLPTPPVAVAFAAAAAEAAAPAQSPSAAEAAAAAVVEEVVDAAALLVGGNPPAAEAESDAEPAGA